MIIILRNNQPPICDALYYTKAIAVLINTKTKILRKFSVENMKRPLHAKLGAFWTFLDSNQQSPASKNSSGTLNHILETFQNYFDRIQHLFNHIRHSTRLHFPVWVKNRIKPRAFAKYSKNAGHFSWVHMGRDRLACVSCRTGYLPRR